MRLKRIIWIGSLAIVLAATSMGFRFRPVVISGASMRPALQDGQVALMDRQPVDKANIKRGDIVIFHHGRELFVKRVYALQGDAIRVVTFANGAIGMVGDAAFREERILRLAKAHPQKVHISRAIIPRGTVYVIGDNRTYSIDSRDFGPISAVSIIGKVVSTREAIASMPHRLLPIAFASTEAHPATKSNPVPPRFQCE